MGSSRGTVLSSGVSCNTFLPTSWLMTAPGSCAAAAGNGGVRVSVLLRASTLRHDMHHVGVLLPLSTCGMHSEGAGMSARAGRSPGAATAERPWVATAVMLDPAQPRLLPSQAPPKILHLHECDIFLADQATLSVLPSRCRKQQTAKDSVLLWCPGNPNHMLKGYPNILGTFAKERRSLLLENPGQPDGASWHL